MLSCRVCSWKSPRGKAVWRAQQPAQSNASCRAATEERVIPKPTEDRVRINEMIRVKQVRVIDENSNQLGIMSPQDALREAMERGYDLVEVAPNGQPPVCRIMDYGKYKYQQSKREREAKKHQHTISIKEVKFRPKIDKHDFEYKVNRAKEFLREGDKVKVTIMFRGREVAHPEFGHEILRKVLEELEGMVVEKPEPQALRVEGRTMTLVVTPTKELQKEARKEKDRAPQQPQDEDGEKASGEQKAESDKKENDANAEKKKSKKTIPVPESEL